ncbi:MAG TPA: hypothetical protein VIG63_04290 [Savagea sp.]
MTTYTTIERCHKETDEVIETLSKEALDTPMNQLEKWMDSFIYLESPHFDQLQMDCLTLEKDDVFLTYTALFGLHLPKDQQEFLKYYIETHTNPTLAKHAILYSDKDRMFDVNFTLDALEGFNAQLTIQETIDLLSAFMADFQFAREKQ